MAGRSIPKWMNPWQTLTVEVMVVRGEAKVRARVVTTFVTGKVDAPYRPNVLWEGVVHERSAAEQPSPEEAADWAHLALNSAFPSLF